MPPEPPIEPDPSRVLSGPHRCVVLFDSQFPRKTVTILPITSLNNEHGERKSTLLTDLILNATDYEQCSDTYKGTITKDSIIRTEQIRTVSRHLLERKTGELLPKDMLKLDILLIAALQLEDTVSKLIEGAVERRLSSIQRTRKVERDR